MEQGSPLGPDFDRWVQSTDEYASRLTEVHLGDAVPGGMAAPARVDAGRRRPSGRTAVGRGFDALKALLLAPRG